MIRKEVLSATHGNSYGIADILARWVKSPGIKVLQYTVTYNERNDSYFLLAIVEVE